jgi:hypothetical protein
MKRSSEACVPSSDVTKSTLLGPIFAGNYSHFKLQRDWLKKLAGEGGLLEYGAKPAEQQNPWDSVVW